MKFPKSIKLRGTNKPRLPSMQFLTQQSIFNNGKILNEFSTKVMNCFQASLALQTWTDQRFNWSNTTYANISDMYVHEDNIWLPQIVVDNTFDRIISMSGSNLLLHVTSEGLVTWQPPGLYNTHCAVDTTWFPFDVQTCSISVSGWPYDVEDITITNNVSKFLTSDYRLNGEWQLYWTFVSPMATGDRTRLNFVLKLERRYAFYVMNVIVPVLLTSLLTPMVFKLPSESGERVSFILTVVLALEVLLTVVSAHMPATSLHTSVMEVYLVMVLSISGLAVILTALLLKLYHKGDDAALPKGTRLVLEFHKLITRRTATKTTKRKPSLAIDNADSKPCNETTEESLPGKLTNNYVMEEFDKVDAVKTHERITCREFSNILDDILFWAFFCLTLLCTFVFMLAMGFGGS
ncbi:neuronal acetylcholine receptor subunit alpha-2-like [Pecten maximus]|uniref:neuronal acetylcholine receptor subunit alpha-2-like n=1 Tax=Pecten maximus TaxID=6579 RepID=UPI001457ECA7|nr:neuronal acetylcholine receptor subunit alpha-2-like [Pecten maximus]